MNRFINSHLSCGKSSSMFASRVRTNEVHSCVMQHVWASARTNEFVLTHQSCLVKLLFMFTE